MAEPKGSKFNGNLKHDALLFVIKNLIAKEKHEEAHFLLDHFYSQANDVTEFDILGEMAIEGKYPQMQLKCAKAVYTRVTSTENLFGARENIYKSLMALNFPEEALFYIELNLKFKPKDFETLSQKAFALALMNRRKEAEDILGSLIAESDEQRTGLEFAMSGKQLRDGDTARGIRNFIATFKPKNYFFEERLKLKLWEGSPQPGKTLIVNGEGGIGDEIINIRFFKQIEEYGMRPILYSSFYEHRPDLTDVFRRNGYEVVTNNKFFKKDYMWTHMMPLPGYLGLKENQLWTGPYLTPKRDTKNQLNDKKFKIGIKCNGNPYFEQDVYRCIPIEKLLEYLPKDASIYYFDKEKTHPDTISLKDQLNTWDDTLDLIDQMDVIVSSCTSLVHAAGAMGKRTIVIVPIAEYYTWTSTRTNESTPWYGENFKVLKQQKVRDWDEPLARAQVILEQYMNPK
jgi:hypothetical protein